MNAAKTARSRILTLFVPTCPARRGRSSCSAQFVDDDGRQEGGMCSLFVAGCLVVTATSPATTFACCTLFRPSHMFFLGRQSLQGFQIPCHAYTPVHEHDDSGRSWVRAYLCCYAGPALSGDPKVLSFRIMAVATANSKPCPT